MAPAPTMAKKTLAQQEGSGVQVKVSFLLPGETAFPEPISVRCQERVDQHIDVFSSLTLSSN